MIEAIVICAFLYCVVVPMFILAGIWAMATQYHQKYIKPTFRHLYKAIKAKRIYVSSHPALPDLKCPMATSVIESNGHEDKPDEEKMNAIRDQLRSGY